METQGHKLVCTAGPFRRMPARTDRPYPPFAWQRWPSAFRAFLALRSMQVGTVECFCRIGDMRRRIRATIMVNPGPHRGSVHCLKWIGLWTAVLPNSAEIAQHPLLVL